MFLDVPQCPAGTPVENCTHEISGVVTPPAGNMHFVGAHYHCHAPTCLKMEIFNNITGELLCREEPYHGQGADMKPNPRDPTNGPHGDRFDEPGYIAQRVCLWGNETYGLEAPPKVGGVRRDPRCSYESCNSFQFPSFLPTYGRSRVSFQVPLFIRAVTNASYGHHGEMALPQMLVVEKP